ncbi:Lissencephaly-1 [Paramecium bursaria]
MNFKPTYIQCKKFDKNGKIQYEGINYTICINELYVIKQFNMNVQEERNELLKTIDLESYICKQSDLFIGPISFDIKDTLIYIQYPKVLTIRQFIADNPIKVVTQELQEDLELYNELIGDNENVFEPKQEDYIKTLKQCSQDLNLDSTLKQLIIQLYELECKGITIPKISINNTIIQLDNKTIHFMDLYLKSSNFELTLEAYILHDHARVRSPYRYEQVRELGLIFLQLYLRIDLEYQTQKPEEFLLQLKEYFGEKYFNLLQEMIFGDIQNFAYLIRSDNFTEFISPIDPLASLELFKEFHLAKQLQKEEVWNRIQQRFQEDNQILLWESQIKSNLKFLIPPKPLAFSRTEYQFQSSLTLKIEDQPLCCETINIEDGLDYKRVFICATMLGSIQIYNDKLIFAHKLSNKPLRIIKKLKLDNQLYILVAGDEAICYMIKQKQITSPIETIKLIQKYAITSIEGLNDLVVIGDEMGIIHIYSNWVLIKQFEAHKKRINQILNNNYLYTVSDDFTIKVWDQQFELKHMLTGHISPVKFILLKDSQLYSFSNDNMVRMWQYQNQWKFIYQYKFNYQIECGVIDKDLILGCQNGFIVQFNRKVIYEQKVHLQGVHTLKWLTRSTNTLFTLGRDSVLKILKI